MPELALDHDHRNTLMRPGPACSNVTGPALAGETTVTPSELACGGCRSAIGRCLCSFEAVLRRYELDDPVLWAIARIVHEADLEDERYDAPEARGLDVLLRGLSMSAPITRFSS